MKVSCLLTSTWVLPCDLIMGPACICTFLAGIQGSPDVETLNIHKWGIGDLNLNLSQFNFLDFLPLFFLKDTITDPSHC